MKIKFFTVEDSVTAQEGFWIKLQHAFTKDSKSGAIVGDMIAAMSKLTPEQKLKLEKTVIDFACPRADIMLAASRYVSAVAKFMVENFKDIQKAEIESKDARELYKKLNTKLNAIKRDLDRFGSDFSIIIDDPDAALAKRICFKDRTYSAIGFTVTRTLDLAKQFQKNYAGNLATLRKASWGTLVKAHDEISKHGIIGEFSNFYNYTSVAMKMYKKIDYFLYYTSKKVSRF